MPVCRALLTASGWPPTTFDLDEWCERIDHLETDVASVYGNLVMLKNDINLALSNHGLTKLRTLFVNSAVGRNTLRTAKSEMVICRASASLRDRALRRRQAFEDRESCRDGGQVYHEGAIACQLPGASNA